MNMNIYFLTQNGGNLTTDDTDDTDIFRELNREIRGTRGRGEIELNQFCLSVYIQP
jgi:hypothetical protein